MLYFLRVSSLMLTTGNALASSMRRWLHVDVGTGGKRFLVQQLRGFADDRAAAAHSCGGGRVAPGQQVSYHTRLGHEGGAIAIF